MIYRFVSLIGLLSVSIVLSSCETTKEPDAATVARLSSTGRSGTAAVIVYRPQNYAGSILSPTVQIDGKSLVDIDNGRVFIAAIPPGHHVFNVENQNSGTEVTLKPGGRIYLKVEIVAGLWKGHGQITQVAGEQGEFEAKRLKLIDSNQIAPAYRR